MKAFMIRLISIFTAAALALSLCSCGESSTGADSNVIIISELMSNNVSIAPDRNGVFYDWVELYNQGSSDVNLRGYFLSDNEKRPRRWSFPDVVISAGGYLVIKLSGLNEVDAEGNIHASFRLSAKGEPLMLINPSGQLVSRIEVAESMPNISYGISSEGELEGQYAWFLNPTPGEKNTGQHAENAGNLKVEGNGIVINEYMSNNSFTLYDSDGDYSDWIEIFNGSGGDASLEGYALSDDTSDSLKWVLPDVMVPKGEYLVVFLSGKDKRISSGELHANFSIGKTDNQLSLSSPQGILIDVAELTPMPDNISCGRNEKGDFVYFSRPTPGKKNTTPGIKNLEGIMADISNGVFISEVCSVSSANSAYPEDWIEIHNSTAQDVNLSGYELLDDLNNRGSSMLPDKVIHAGGYLVINAIDSKAENSSQISAGFTLSSGGEELFLIDDKGSVVDYFKTGKQRDGISSGRKGTDLHKRYFFQAPSPGSSNSGSAFESYTSNPVFSSLGGYAQAGDTLEITYAAGSTVRYTLDGNIPDENSTLYTAPIKIEKSTVVRAMSFSSSAHPSDIVTATFLVEEKHDIPVVCLSSNHDGLFSYSRGIFETGAGWTEEIPHRGANYWWNVERPVSFEYFEKDGNKALDAPADIRIFGQYSRMYPQKSIALFFREKNGQNEVTYPFFEDNPVQTHKSLVLRMGGQDSISGKIKDAFNSQLCKGIETVDIMDSQPCALYINGNYYGLYYIREKINEAYMESHHAIAEENIDIIFGQSLISAGNNESWKELMSYVRANNLKNKEKYDYLATQMDMLSFADWWIIETYIGNSDTGNIKCYRDRTNPNSKWRWVIYDTDVSLNGSGFNSLARMISLNGHGAANFDTTLMRKLLTNDEFKQLFADRYKYHLENTFKPERLLALFDKMAQEIESEIPRQSERWGYPTVSTWNSTIKSIRKFIEERPEKIKLYLKSTLGIQIT